MGASGDRSGAFLTIAGSDSGGGAGLQADLKTSQAFGVFGTSVVTCVTAQNTVEVREVTVLPARVVLAQIDAVLSDIPVAAIKTGVLPSVEIVRAVAEVLQRPGMPPAIVDPVLVATSGDALAGSDVARELADVLLPAAALVTPNLEEARVLSGRGVETLEEMRAAAAALRDRGARAVLIKGGHLQGLAVDVLLDDQGFEEFSAPRVGEGSAHGTGCTLSAAIAAGMARGLSLRDAVGRAKKFVHRAIENSRFLGAGSRVLDFGTPS